MSLAKTNHRFTTIALVGARVRADLHLAPMRPGRLAGPLVTGLTLAFLLPAATVAGQPDVLVIRNARIFPVTGPVIVNGGLLVENGKITAVGADVPIPGGARVIDARGKSVMPGIVESHSNMGMKRLWG